MKEARNKAETKEKELKMKKRQEIDERIENEKRAAILEVMISLIVLQFPNFLKYRFRYRIRMD